MPSPFPGMDPYLENPHWWPTVHHGVIHEIMRQLNQQLRPKYFAAVEERVYVTDEDDPIQGLVRVPDVRVSRTSWEAESLSAQQVNGGLAVAEPLEIDWQEEEVHEARVEIVDALRKDIVAVIEVVSPSNKLFGSAGRESYLQKRKQVRQSSAHWLEVDLLRGGMATVSSPRVPTHDYLIHLSRNLGERRRSVVWAILLPQQLPNIAVPLRGSDPAVHLNLQTLLGSTYDAGNFDLRIDYTGDPVPPFTPTQAAWADELLKAKGLRT